MTRKTAIKKFREHWKWLSKNPLAEKEDYPPIKGSTLIVNNDCFLCQYIEDNLYNCRYCPISWGDKDHCVGSVVSKWSIGEECEGYYPREPFFERILPSGRAIIARKISELPEKDENYPTPGCWSCANYKFVWRSKGQWAYCLSKKDWFPENWDFWSVPDDCNGYK